MADALATTTNRTGRRGTNWGLPPNIARASASREPKKPPPPVEAIKPAPEVVTIAPPPIALSQVPLYRLILDLEALQDGFADRIMDLNFSLTEVDAASELTRGNAQKLLSKSDAKWAREFGWKSLGKMLKGTGLALALIVDDERFRPIKEQMTQRRQKRQPKLLAPPSSPGDRL